MKTVSIRLYDYQIQKIESSGLTVTDFIRRAVDSYNEDVRQQVLQEIINYCNTNVIQYNTGVRQCITDPQKEGGKNTQNNTIYDNCKTMYDNCKTKKDKKTTEIPPNLVARKLKDKFPMLQRVLNNPDNLNSLPDFTVKTLTKDYNISKASLNNFIEVHKEALKSGNFDEIV